MSPWWEALLNGYDHFFKWDSTENTIKGSHQEIVLWVLSAAYGIVALIALLLFSSKLWHHHVTLKRSKEIGDVDDKLRFYTSTTMRALVIFPLIFFATFLRSFMFASHNSASAKEFHSVRNIAVDIPFFYVFMTYTDVSCGTWDSYLHTHYSVDVAASKFAYHRVLILCAGGFLQCTILMCQYASILDGISLFSARLIVQLYFLAGIIWLQVHEYMKCLSYEKDNGLQASVWQALFSQCETFKKARQAIPKFLKDLIFIGVSSFCAKVYFTTLFVVFYQFDKNVLPSELDDATTISIGNLVYYCCTELQPYAYMLLFLARNFNPARVCREENYLPIHQTEM